MKYSDKLQVINIFILLWVSALRSATAQTGCTDPQASNYNAAATINDGSCIYPTTNIALADKTALITPLLDETSGVVFTDGFVWTHNDSGNSNTIYRIDSVSNTVLQTVVISNATNVDWEDITADADYLYIADCGNNNGNRTNLKIYRVAKSALTLPATTATADVINYSYSDQTIFTSLPNNNNYDCESIIYYNDSLHLFSKDWVDKQTRHYVLPAIPGTYTAQFKETLNAGYLITGAAIQNNILAFIGYDNTGFAPVYVYMCYDFKDGLFFNGNKRRFNASNALSYGQTEGIDFRNDGYGYITNERFKQSIFNVAPKLRSFNLHPYLPASVFTPAPVAGFGQSKDSVCSRDAIQFTDTSKNQPASWQWSFPGGSPSGSTQQHPIVTYTAPGTYDVSLTVTNAGGNNSEIKTAAVIVNDLPVANITANGPTQFCAGGKVILTASAANGNHYQWKKSNVAIANAVYQSYTAKTTGNYSVLITDTHSCSNQSQPIAVTGPPSATISVTGSLNVCNNDSVKMRANGGAGYTYQWQKNAVNISGAVNQVYYGKYAGVYRVAVTDSYGCSKYSGTKTITNNCPSASRIEQESFINVYPNPFTDAFTVEADENTTAVFSVYDLSGRTVMENVQLLSGEAISAGSQLKPGVYFISVAGDEQKEVIRLVKIK